MKYLYNKNTGLVIARLSDNIDVDECLYHFPIEQKRIIGYIESNIDIRDHHNYKVTNGVLVKKSPEELNPFNIDKAKNQLIYLSKLLLTQYLETHPLLFTDGKYYSVTQEKQNLLNNAITVYQMKIQLGQPAEIKWNATGDECTIWNLEDIVALALAIANYVEPLVTYQQTVEVQIRECTTQEELESIVIDYAMV